MKLNTICMFFFRCCYCDNIIKDWQYFPMRFKGTYSQRNVEEFQVEEKTSPRESNGV